MSGASGNQGDFQHKEENFNYNDGTTSHQYHFRQTTHASQVTPALPSAHDITGCVHLSLAAPGLSSPQLLPYIGQQLHQNALAHHQQAWQQHQAIAQNIHHAFGGIQTPVQQVAFPQVQRAPSVTSFPQRGASPIAPGPVQTLPQLQYASQTSPYQQDARPQNLLLPGSAQTAWSPMETPRLENYSSDDESDDDDRDRLALIEERQQQTTSAMQREVQKVQDQLRRIERSSARSQREREAKELEALDLRQQLEDARRQGIETEQRHAREILQLQQAHAATTPKHAESLDLSAIKAMVEDVQKQRIDLDDDLKQLIKSTLSQSLEGVARSSELEAAARTMKSRLQSVSTASDDRCRRKLLQELAAANQQISNAMPSGRTSLEAPSRSEPTSGRGDDDLHTHKGNSKISTPHSQSQKPLPLPATEGDVRHGDGSVFAFKGAGVSSLPNTHSNAVPVLMQPGSQSALSRMKSSHKSTTSTAGDHSESRGMECALSRISSRDRSWKGELSSRKVAESRMSSQQLDVKTVTGVNTSDKGEHNKKLLSAVVPDASLKATNDAATGSTDIVRRRSSDARKTSTSKNASATPSSDRPTGLDQALNERSNAVVQASKEVSKKTKKKPSRN